MTLFACVFPGQGSQRLEMGKFLFDNFKIAQEIFEEASDILKINFIKLCFEDPKKQLDLTEFTQPSLCLISYIYYQVIKNVIDLDFKYSAGHSVGEYSSALVGDVFDFPNALKATQFRGKIMQEAVGVGQGGMCALIGPNINEVKELCKWAEKESGIGPVEPANYNSPQQIVISGNLQALKWMETNILHQNIYEKKMKFIPLKVSAPFHSSLMEPAKNKMKIFLHGITFNDSKVPIIQNYDANVHYKANEIKENLIKQISASVQWVQSVIQLKKLKVTHIIELGPGNVLNGLIKKIDSESFKTYNMNSLDEIKIIEKILKA